jgi:hypothetical protein
MWLVGDYRFGGCVIDGKRYVVIKNDDVIERIQLYTSTGNPVIWREGDAMSEAILEIIGNADFTMDGDQALDAVP